MGCKLTVNTQEKDPEIIVQFNKNMHQTVKVAKKANQMLYFSLKIALNKNVKYKNNPEYIIILS